MTRETARRALELAHASREGFPNLVVAFFGGEPLLAFGLLQEIVGDAEALSQSRSWPTRFIVTTNGTMLTHSRTAWLAEHGLEVTVSIDGWPIAHNQQRTCVGGAPSHMQVAAGIRAAQRHLSSVKAALTVTPATARQLVKGLDYIRRLGIADVQVTPDYDSRCWAPEERRVLAIRKRIDIPIQRVSTEVYADFLNWARLVDSAEVLDLTFVSQ